MKKLTRKFIRQEDDPDYDSEVWQPSWHCFCCHDTGEVHPHLAKLIIDRYELGKDKIPRCQNPGCIAGGHLDSSTLKEMIDYRFTPDICQELDTFHREDWQQTRRIQATLIAQKVAWLAKSKSLRQADRTLDEEINTRQKHAMAIAAWEELSSSHA